MLTLDQSTVHQQVGHESRKVFEQRQKVLRPNERRGSAGESKKSKPRNLLERLRDYEDDTLRFMTPPEIPFTNSQEERDLRMSKVQQKISGIFRSMKGAKIFCRIRSYLSTFQKQNIPSTTAMELLFGG